jgi:hypothetical protein
LWPRGFWYGTQRGNQVFGVQATNVLIEENFPNVAKKQYAFGVVLLLAIANVLGGPWSARITTALTTIFNSLAADVSPSQVTAFANVKAPEPFVSAEEAARFLSVKRRQLLALARRGLAGGYPLGTGSVRKVWVFRLSELAAAIEQHLTTPRTVKRDTIPPGQSSR